MSKDKTFCDDCGDEIEGKDFLPVTHLPFSVASANEGESAILCKGCVWKDGRLGKLIERPVPPRVHVAMWNHKHGTDAFVSETKEGLQKTVVQEVILGWVDDLHDENDIKKIKRLAKAGKFAETIAFWSEVQNEDRGHGEWVEITSTEVGE